MSKAQDPFATTSDPNLYVPRRATERALDALADATWHQGGIAALLGPPGVGKSLLLRVLARRAEDELHCIHVPVPTLDPEGITLWVASRLPGGRRLGGSETLLEVARERPLLLLVEDAELMPGESARAIAEMHRASEGAIRAVFAVNAEELPEELAASLEPQCVTVALGEAMDRDEAVAYVTRRLAAAGVPQSVAERFDAGTIATLHESSGGNPARFNAAARGHMPVASRALAPQPPESGGPWRDPFPLEPTALQEPPPSRDRARRRWVWGLSWALGASTVTFAAGLLLGFWLRGPGLSATRQPVIGAVPSSSARPASERVAAPRAGSASPDLTGSQGSAPVGVSPGVPRAAPGAVAAGANPTASVERTPVVAAPAAASSDARAPVGPSLQAESDPGAPGPVSLPVVGEPQRQPAPAAVVSSRAELPVASEDRSRGSGAPVAAADRGSDAPVAAADRGSDAPVAAADRGSDAPVAAAAAVDAGRSSGAEPTANAQEGTRSADLRPRGSQPANALFAPEFPRELTAALNVTADPPAFIEIDGRPFGPTPIRIDGLRPGVRRLVAHFRTGETMSQELVLGSGERDLVLRGPVRRAPARPFGGTPSEDTSRDQTAP